MLVLTRKVDQGIRIRGDIKVRVLGVERDRVKFGFNAPDEVGILRQELVGTEHRAARKPHRLGGTLVLERKTDEGVAIDTNINLMVLGVERGRVKVGIEAPPNVRIDREETLSEGKEGRAHRSKEAL